MPADPRTSSARALLGRAEDDGEWTYVQTTVGRRMVIEPRYRYVPTHDGQHLESRLFFVPVPSPESPRAAVRVKSWGGAPALFTSLPSIPTSALTIKSAGARNVMAHAAIHSRLPRSTERRDVVPVADELRHHPFSTVSFVCFGNFGPRSAASGSRLIQARPSARTNSTRSDPAWCIPRSLSPPRRRAASPPPRCLLSSSTELFLDLNVRMT